MEGNAESSTVALTQALADTEASSTLTLGDLLSEAQKQALDQRINTWVQENESAIITGAQAVCGFLNRATAVVGLVAESALTAVQGWARQIDPVKLERGLVTFARWVTRFEAAASAAERLLEIRRSVERGHQAFAANDTATILAFTRDVLKLPPTFVEDVFLALVQSEWRMQWDPITYLQRYVRNARRTERRRERTWRQRHLLILDHEEHSERLLVPNHEQQGGFGPLVSGAFDEGALRLSTDERIELSRAVDAGEITRDEIILLDARLRGVSRAAGHALGWEPRRMESTWKRMERHAPVFLKRLKD